MTPAVDAALTTPVVAAAALGALLLLVAASGSTRAFGTIAHESGHMVVGILTGHRIRYFEVTSGGAGGTYPDTTRWGPGRILTVLAGYVTPPLLGLGGAALFDAGRILPLLWTAVVLLVLTLIKAEREWTTFVVLLLAAATGYVALYGMPVLQAGFAAGLVWLLLFDGLPRRWWPVSRRTPIPTACSATRSSRERCGRRASSWSRSSACGRAPSSWCRRRVRTASRGSSRDGANPMRVPS